ncbi:conserved hypothetical protein [Verticillium alfalfae VaMs.102]|uniref:CENP-V/GFA domain-containing protein n=1 Tax=Verticillium alfalfae (strain VaMs.102 / ATCC MYA-4576 / FGSC 10136) TaxID=526221 RepID=C9SUU6_VERA1|nr:conserved hypothetical protein [Verticillium alfalfae VaMs.102]EEY22561.1 conserved hypothetical protein [Verticillium alfalfae VaMs.102]
MSLLRPLRGGCHCGRNRYIIDVPENETELAQVIFNTDSLHRSSLATPLAAFLRVPLAWHRSSTTPFFPDETHAMIHRVFESQDPAQRQTKRYFCGYCGTPLSFWTERPQREADFIQLTLASLAGEDLRDLEDMGLLPELEDTRSPEAEPEPDSEPEPEPDVESENKSGVRTVQIARRAASNRESQSVPWFNSLVEGSRLGKTVRQGHSITERRNGTTTVEWEIVEWTEDDDDRDGNVAPEVEDVDMSSGNMSSGNRSNAGSKTGKRKLRDRGDSDVAAEGTH